MFLFVCFISVPLYFCLRVQSSLYSFHSFILFIHSILSIFCLCFIPAFSSVFKLFSFLVHSFLSYFNFFLVLLLSSLLFLSYTFFVLFFLFHVLFHLFHWLELIGSKMCLCSKLERWNPLWNNEGRVIGQPQLMRGTMRRRMWHPTEPPLKNKFSLYTMYSYGSIIY